MNKQPIDCDAQLAFEGIIQGNSLRGNVWEFVWGIFLKGGRLIFHAEMPGDNCLRGKVCRRKYVEVGLITGIF